MRKSILATLCGVVLGIVLMIGVFSILNMRPSNESMLAQNGDQNHTEVNKEETVVNKTEVEDFGIVGIGSILAGKNHGATETEEAAEETETSNTTTVPTQLPYYIKVNRQANCVTVYTYDEEGNYTIPVKAMTCSVGLNNSTPLGVSKISDKYTWRLLFGNTYGHYSVRFNGHILFHSVPYLTASNDNLKEGQFNLLGEPASLGCIRLCVADVKWIYDNCAKGTVVEVYDSPDPGPLGKPSMPKIHPNSPFRGWDPTDPNTSNPWLYGSVAIQGVTNISINAGETVDLLVGVSATDVDGMEIDVTVDGEVDFYTPGNYQITYNATGVLGHTASASVVVTVLASETETVGTEMQNTEIPSVESTQTLGTENTEVSGTETPGTEIPGTEVPNTEVSSTEIPNTEVSSTEVPSTETQSIETQSTEVPEAEVQSTEILNTEAQSTEVLSTETTSTEALNTEMQNTEN